MSLGEKNYDHKLKQNVWTNYDAALFAKDGQVDFYRSALIEGAVVQVSGMGIIVDDTDKQYKPKLMIQDAKLGFVHSSNNQQQNQNFQQKPQGQDFQPQNNQPQTNQGGFQQPQGGFQQNR